MTKGTNKRVWALVIASGALALTAACGSSGSGSGSGSDSGAADAGSDSGLGPMTQVTVEVTGEVTVKGTSKALPATRAGKDFTSCAEYAKGETRDSGSKYFVLPENLDDPIGGKQVHVGAEIEDYTGPAAYDTDHLTDIGGGAGVGFDGKQYFQGEGTKSTVSVTGDGGGKWEFTGLVVQNDNNTQSGGKLSGSITWTCKNS